MIRILLSGSEGRMGQTLKNLILKDQELKLEGSFDKKSSLFEFEKLESKNLDVVLDFSSPKLFWKMLHWANKYKIPFVSGTTGLDKNTKSKLKEYSKEIPLLWSSNMSLGVALLTKALGVFSEARKEFDFQIEEIHHKHKKDKPSGTALSLQEELKSIVQKDLPEVLSTRAGNVYGIHRIQAFSEDEIISLGHIAMSRKIFAQGALKAVKWIVSKPSGLYEMKDVLK